MSREDAGRCTASVMRARRGRPARFRTRGGLVHQEIFVAGRFCIVACELTAGGHVSTRYSVDAMRITREEVTCLECLSRVGPR